MRPATSILVLCVGALLSLGMVILYSCGTVQNGTSFLFRQLVWFGFGLAGCSLAACLPMGWLERRNWPLVLAFLGVMGLLVMVLVPGVGLEINGARRWLELGFARLQPSELAKPVMILALASYIAKHQRRMSSFGPGLVLPGLLVGCLLGLIFIEPDWGTTLLLASVTVIMLVAGGVRWAQILPCLAVGAVVVSMAIWENPIRRTRVLAFLHPEEYKDTVGYQPWQAMLAFGSGGLTGKGLGDGRQKLGFVPEHQTDFVLSVVGEELGFVATSAVVVAFTGILLCGCLIALRARSIFSKLVAVGITFLICMQAFINIGVVTSSLPNKGISLPFISYGGSNLLVMMTCIGLLLNVARQEDELEEEACVEEATADNPFGPA